MDRPEEERRPGLEPEGAEPVPDERQGRLWPKPGGEAEGAPRPEERPGAVAAAKARPAEAPSSIAAADKSRPADTAALATQAQQQERVVEPGGPGTPAVSQSDENDLRRRWDSVQGSFVDDPHAAVHEADALVGETMDRIRQAYERRRAGLREASDRSGDTEGLRLTIREYRAFLFDILHR
ncbi:MAG: hypothetical protein JF888_12445 [Candidatus Dormibacteraeota bacterium]|uniref:Uncharacterized protein n=1 Tax=Candidatus Dormiibacter inghamiae TaxID=3127013 RepID=A0A934KFW8_9BACT|nr:hypothetical protein [Candidatus Dormibacteraeota bacterium]MBJ7604756.1 hypothetical protein [Candidatus Dormibacteraeota bacterium]